MNLNSVTKQPKKLFLTSGGLTNKTITDFFVAELIKPIIRNRVLIIAYSQNPQEEFYVNKSKNELQQLGLKDIVVINMRQVVKVSELGTFDIIYVCGGNVFAILYKLRESGLDNFITEQIFKGAIYVGVSAGSIIACENVDIAGWGSMADKNEIGLKDLTGLNFVNASIFPHFKETLRDEIDSYKQKVQHFVYEITDEQAIFINGDQTKKIGF